MQTIGIQPIEWFRGWRAARNGPAWERDFLRVSFLKKRLEAADLYAAISALEARDKNKETR